jgi:putative ABC transport system permease protein
VIDHVKALVDRLMATRGVVGVSPQTEMLVTLRWRTTTTSRPVVAVDPVLEDTVTHVSQKMMEGRFLLPDDADGIVLGVSLAGGPDVATSPGALKGAHAGDEVTLEVNGVERRLIVRGVFRTKLIIADERALITRHALERLSPSTRDTATRVIVRAEKTGLEEPIIAALKKEGVPGTFSTWEDNAGIMRSVTKSFRSINVLMSFVGLLIAAVTVFIVIYIDVVDRRRQIGILRAIGIKAWIIRLTYVFQSGVYALAGMAVGSAIFLGGLVPYFRAHPFSLPICDAVLLVSAGDYAARAATIVVVALLSGLIPAVQVTRMKVLDAMGGR